MRNLTVGWSRSVSVPYGQNDSFSQGEWLQEDPSAQLSSPGDVPYATTSSVEVRRLQVNGRNPRLRYKDGQALSTADGLNLTPTPVKHDEFSLVEASGFARQYLSDAESFDVAATRLQAKLPTANGEATQAQIQLVNQLAILFGRQTENLSPRRGLARSGPTSKTWHEHSFAWNACCPIGFTRRITQS